MDPTPIEPIVIRSLGAARRFLKNTPAPGFP